VTAEAGGQQRSPTNIEAFFPTSPFVPRGEGVDFWFARHRRLNTTLRRIRKGEKLAQASTDHIGHYLDNPNFVHDHREIEPSLEHKGNRPTERESL
jgi:hypothetical protein